MIRNDSLKKDKPTLGMELCEAKVEAVKRNEVYNSEVLAYHIRWISKCYFGWLEKCGMF